MQSVVQRYFPAINDPMQHVSEEESGLIFEGGKLLKDKGIGIYVLIAQ